VCVLGVFFGFVVLVMLNICEDGDVSVYNRVLEGVSWRMGEVLWEW